MKYLKVKEVAEEFRVSKRTVFRYIKSGNLPAVKIGQWRITRSDINDFLEKSSQKLYKGK